MAADFGLVAHPAQRNPYKLASGRPRHRFAKRGLADARRSNQAQDRSLQLACQGLDREILENALLDLLESVMIPFEDALGFLRSSWSSVYSNHGSASSQ